MTDKLTTKEIVRDFLVQKIYSTSRFDLAVLAEKHGIEDEFSVAECFEREAYRVEKLFNFPTYHCD
jgi:hypothetical protein